MPLHFNLILYFMKYLILFPFFLLFSTSLLAQKDITLNFNSTGSGRNITLGLSKPLNKKSEIAVGLRFNINTLKMPDDQNHVFIKRLYAMNFFEHLGIQGNYRHSLFSNWESIKPYYFYDLQITYSSTRSVAFLPYDIEYTTGDYLYKRYVIIAGPYFWTEHNIGIGFKAHIYKNFYLFQNFGVGGIFIIGKDIKRPETYDKFSFEFGYLISSGIAYSL